MIPRNERSRNFQPKHRKAKLFPALLRLAVVSCITVLMVLIPQQAADFQVASMEQSQSTNLPVLGNRGSDSALTNEALTDKLERFAQMITEKKERRAKEAAYYLNEQVADQIMNSDGVLIPSTASPGDIILVRHNQPGKVNWLDKEYKLEPFGEGYFAYLPIGIGTKPGTYKIGDQVLTIQAKQFDTQSIKVTQQMASMKQETDRIQADQKKINLARSQSSPDFLFTTNFIQPVEGVLTTPYGYTRYVNGKLDSRHTAIDLAAKEGTPIHATNDGIVALADNLYLTGNSIYIDHGMNLFSQYAHMSKLLVKTGDKVKQGDIIGLVGTTGFSTGPHLHFTFWAHNVPVNPNLFFGTTPFHW